MGILRFFNFLKMVAMIFGICYFWVWTSDNRLVDMDVIEQLCKSGALDMTFHENRLFGKVDDATAKEKNNDIKREQIRQSDSVVFHDFAEGAIGHMPKLKWKKDCDKIDAKTGLDNPKCLDLDHDMFGAFVD